MGERATGPRWSRLDHDERRRQILAVARRQFAEHPYGAVSTTVIAEEAGITRGLLHHYFGTKRALYLEAIEELVASPAVDFLETVVAPPTGAGEWDWERGVDTWMDLMETDKEAWLLAFNAGETGRDPEMQQMLDTARERTATQVLRVLQLDRRDEPEVRSVVRAFARYAEEIIREWLQVGRLSRGQARVLLVGTLPLLVDRLLPDVVAARRQQDD